MSLLASGTTRCTSPTRQGGGEAPVKKLFWRRVEAGANLRRVLARTSVVALLSAAISVVNASAGVVYYVATNGSDSGGDGSLERPLATISRALSMLPDTGGEVQVAGGVYRGSVRISRQFKQTVLIRASRAYRAVLESDHQPAVDADRGGNIEMTGFEVRRLGAPNNPQVVVSIRNGKSLVFRDNIIHDSDGLVSVDNNIHGSERNPLVQVSQRSQNVLLIGNLLYSQSIAGGRHIEVNGATDVVVRDNIFFHDVPVGENRGAATREEFIAIRNSNAQPENRRISVSGNIFLNWAGGPEKNFIVVGGEGKPFFEAQDVVIENNLVLGNSLYRVHAPLGIKGVRDVVIRNNDISGDLPSLAYSAELKRNGENPRNQNIRFSNNLWSDQAGTMDALIDGTTNDAANVVLNSNLYWNGGQPMPSRDTFSYTSDPSALTADPALPTPAGVTLPKWTGDAFVSGSASIRQEFKRLVMAYGNPGSFSPVVGRGDPASSAQTDILGRLRGQPPDIGVLQASASWVPFHLLLIPEEVVGGQTIPLNQVLLEDPAGPDGAYIFLKSSNPGVAAVPQSTLVRPGQMAASFAIATSPVTTTTAVTISGLFAEAIQTRLLIVKPLALRSVNLNPGTLAAGGSSSRNVILLDGVAPDRGLEITLSSSNPAIVAVPNRVTVTPSSSVSNNFTVSAAATLQQASVVITASLGSSRVSTPLVVRAGPSPVVGELGNISVAGVTSTQAILTYTAPDSSPCTVQLSEIQDFGDSYQPLHDVNPALFPSANQDNRPGNLSSGLLRTFVLGKRAVEKGLDGRKYSRALQANTPHYFQITCGSQQAAGQFTTANIPLGSTYAEPLLPDPSGNGLYNHPSLDWTNRNERIIDHLTGAEIRKITLPSDFAETAANRSVNACTGNNWNSPEACSAPDGNTATYSAGAQDILYAPAAFNSANGTLIFDTINVSLRASVSGSPSGDDKYIDLCLTKDGLSCMTPWKALDLTTCSLSDYQGDCSNAGSSSDMDFWGSDSPVHGWIGAPKNGFLIRPRSLSTAYVISIDSIRYTVKSTTSPSFPAHAGQPLCSFVPISDLGDGNTYYLCYTFTARRLYSVDVTHGKAYYLGPLVVSSSPFRNVTEIMFDQTNPRVFYAIQPSENYVLKGEWTGSLTSDYTGTFLVKPDGLQWTNLTPPGYTLKEILPKFDRRFDEEWQSKIGPTRFSAIAIQNNKVVLQFQTGQDNGGWLVIFDPSAAPPPASPGQGNVVAAYYVGQSTPSRFCTIHTSIGDFSSEPWVIIGHGRPAKGTGYFAGPWQVRVRKPGGGSLDPGDTVFEVVPFNGGDGPTDPTDPTPSGGQNDLTIPAQPGDAFYYDANQNGLADTGDEVIEIVSINGNPNKPLWTVRRGNHLSESPFLDGTGRKSAYNKVFSIPEGAVLEAFCRAQPLDRGGDPGTTFWNFEADPHANTFVYPGWNGYGTFPDAGSILPNSSGFASPQVHAHKNIGSHGHTKLDQGIRIGDSGYQDCQAIQGKTACWAVQTGTEASVINADVAFRANRIPAFSGILPPGQGGAYQSHVGFLQSRAIPAEKRWAFDIMPLDVGTGVYGSTGSPESETQSVYKVNNVRLNRKHLGTLATCGERSLKDISSPATGNVISDATPYTYCVANAANECRSGASPGDAYVACPGRTLTGCASNPFTSIYPSTVVDICFGDSWALGHGVVQVPLAADSPMGEQTRIIGYPFPIPHLQGIFAAAKAMPDASWALFLGQRHERSDVYLLKVPPYPAPDGINRQQFIPVPVPVMPQPGGASAVVEFGYTENDSVENFQCTTRKEGCLAAVSTIDPAQPFQFVSENTSAVACTDGCTIEVPALSQHVVYYRVKYLNRGGRPVSTGDIHAVAVP